MQHNSGTKTTNHAEESTQVNRVQVNRVQVNRVQVNQLVEEGLEQVWIAEHRYLRTSTIPTLICLVLCPLSRPLPLTLNNFRLREKLGQCLWDCTQVNTGGASATLWGQSIGEFQGATGSASVFLRFPFGMPMATSSAAHKLDCTCWKPVISGCSSVR